MRRTSLFRRALLSLAAGLAITLALSAAISLRLLPRGTPTTRVTFDWRHPYGGDWLMTVDHAGPGWTHRARSLVSPQSYGLAGTPTGPHITLTLDAAETPSPAYPVALPPRGAPADLDPLGVLVSKNPPRGTLFNWPFQVRTGWPERSMAYWNDGVAGWGPFAWGSTPRERRIAWGYQVGAPAMPMDERVIPFEPLWPGLAVNTLFWAAPIFAVFVAIPHLRRARHIRRGRCPGCAYPLGGLSTCPECGAPAPVRASA